MELYLFSTNSAPSHWKEIEKAEGDIILFIDELHTLVSAGATEGAVAPSNMLKPTLSRGALRCVGANTLNEYRQYIEKALLEVFEELLQILNDGRGTDGHGRKVDFKNSIVIITSYVERQWSQECGASQGEEMEARITEALRARFKPEFLNHIDEIIISHNLTAEQISEIVDIQIAKNLICVSLNRSGR